MLIKESFCMFSTKILFKKKELEDNMDKLKRDIQILINRFSKKKTQKKVWLLRGSNPRPFGLVPKTSALDRSAK